jgi:hypothetical protein
VGSWTIPGSEVRYATRGEAEEAQRAAIDAAKEREADRRRREREYQRQLSDQKALENWEAIRANLESMRDQARSGPTQAAETTRLAVVGGRFEDALASAHSLPAFEYVLTVAETELAFHMESRPPGRLPVP